MVTISLGVPGKQRSSRIVPPARRRNWTVMSTGPWPMSVLPCHVPTRAFMRSNSAEAGFGLGGSLALRQTAPARSKVAHIEVIFVFIGFNFRVVVRTFMKTTNGEGRGGHWIWWIFSKGGLTREENEKFKLKGTYGSYMPLRWSQGGSCRWVLQTWGAYGAWARKARPFRDLKSEIWDLKGSEPNQRLVTSAALRGKIFVRFYRRAGL